MSLYVNFSLCLTGVFLPRQLTQQMKSLDFHRRKWFEASNFAWRNFSSSSVRRMFSFVTILGKAALPEEKLREVR